MLDNGWHFTKRPVPCLVAVGDDTRTPVTVIDLRGNTRFLNANQRDRINPGARAGLSNGYGAVDLSLKQRQRITGNAFLNAMLWGVFFQYTMQPPALHTTMLSDIASPYSAMSAEQAEEALSHMTVPKLFAKFSSMVEPGFMPRITLYGGRTSLMILVLTVVARAQIHAQIHAQILVLNAWIDTQYLALSKFLWVSIPKSNAHLVALLKSTGLVLCGLFVVYAFRRLQGLLSLRRAQSPLVVSLK